MVILKKKQIAIMLFGIVISIFVFISTDEKEETIPTTSSPVSGKTIVVDAGHGVPDEGAESSTRNYRGRNKFKNSIKIAKLTRDKWKYSYINTF